MAVYRCPQCGTLVAQEDTHPGPCSACGSTMPFDPWRVPAWTVKAGVLSGKTLKSLVDKDVLGVWPPPRDEQYQPASLDLRLGGGLYDFPDDEFVTDESNGEPLTIEPGKLYLGHTHDVLDLPDDVIGILAGRSTYGRLGIVVHKTAGILDPGFEGDVTLEIFNFGESPLVLCPGDRVAQVVFVFTDRETEGYSGSYQGQRGPTPADR